MATKRAALHEYLTGAFAKGTVISGIDSAIRFEVHSIRPSIRTDVEGVSHVQWIIELTQRVPQYLDPPDEREPNAAPDYYFRGGCTLVVDAESRQGPLQHQEAAERTAQGAAAPLFLRGGQPEPRRDLLRERGQGGPGAVRHAASVWRGGATVSRVRVRMYRQGLGDCFLLTFPSAGGDRHVLIDCGVLKGTEDATAAMRAVAADIMATTGGTLAALVVTHEHWDHVSGFLQAAEVFSDLKVGEGWFAWTEDAGDDLAQELSSRRKKAQTAVAAAARRLALSEGEGARRIGSRVNALLEFGGGLSAAPGRTTADAMAWPKQRAGAQIKYLTPGGAPHGIPGVEGVRVYVLGPPHDRKSIKKSDPSKTASEVYELGMAGGADAGFMAAVDAAPAGPSTQGPFDRWFGIGDAEARGIEFFRQRYGFDANEAQEWQRIEDEWLGAAGRLALQLDSDTNNTSLALAFELVPSGRVLLFPGDAQVGNWLSWEPLTWTLTGAGDTRTVTVHDLLARTVLYKVGHHGSHNATLREKGLELMTSPELAAMVPVDRRTAKKMEWNMPFPPLLKRLSAKTRGRILDLERGISDTKPEDVSDHEWRQFRSNVDAQPGWIDYWVSL